MKGSTQEVDHTEDCPDWHEDRGHHQTFITQKAGQTTVMHTCDIVAMEATEERNGF